MMKRFDEILVDSSWPIELRSFIFQKKVKNAFRFSGDIIQNAGIPQQFLNPLYFLLKQVQDSLQIQRYQFAGIQLEIIARFLEKNFVDRLNYKETLAPNDQKCTVIANMLWYLMAEHPTTFLDRQIVVWAKRIYNTIFLGSHVPFPLEFDHIQREIRKPMKEEKDIIWHESEAYQQ